MTMGAASAAGVGEPWYDASRGMTILRRMSPLRSLI
jgi:hypothetical protein